MLILRIFTLLLFLLCVFLLAVGFMIVLAAKFDWIKGKSYSTVSRHNGVVVSESVIINDKSLAIAFADKLILIAFFGLSITTLLSYIFALM